MTPRPASPHRPNVTETVDPSRPGSPTHDLRVLAVLPARLASTRLERKVLLAETGLPLFVHTARQVSQCQDISRVLVATDGEEVCEAGQEFNVEVCLTSSNHPSGTDRVHEAVCSLPDTFDVVLNVQADEPDVAPADLSQLIGAFQDPAVEAATLASPILNENDMNAPSVVKVTRDIGGRALYFSRSPIPSDSHRRSPRTQGAPLGLRHIGVYAYRPEALARFCSLPSSPLEEVENLEQLRWLEAGRPMNVVDASHTPRGIDTRPDYEAFVQRVAAAQKACP